MEHNLQNEENQPEERLSDLPISAEQAEEAKGGISLNYTKFEIKNVGMGAANE